MKKIEQSTKQLYDHNWITLNKKELINLNKKRKGILKNINEEDKDIEGVDDMTNEQIYLLNLAKNEHIDRIKTLKTFKKKDIFNEIPYKFQSANIQKVASLKEIKLSTKNLMRNIKENKKNSTLLLIKDFWSEKYYRAMLRLTKLNNLIKETDKERIWKAVKSKEISIIKKSNYIDNSGIENDLLTSFYIQNEKNETEMQNNRL